MAKFKPRLVAPERGDKNFVKTTHGGFNYAINISNGDVMPNCVGYAWGRWRELLGKFHELSRGNAEVWYNKKDGYARSAKPSLGAIACWRQGNTGSGSDGAGHVAVVEAIDSDGTITTSNSAYKGTRFYTRKIKPPYNVGGSFVFQGFIHPPVKWDSPTGRTDAEYNAVAAEIHKDAIGYGWGNNPVRAKKLKAAGFDPLDVQERVNKLFQNGSKPSAGKTDAQHREVARKILNDPATYKHYGNNPGRAEKLRKEGFQPAVVQKYINSGGR